MEGDLPRSGHSYFGTVASAQEAHAILEACKLGLLPRVTRRLTDEERLGFVRAGAVFVWEEEEAGIRRWTDHIKWSPSRVSGAFLTYTEVPCRGDDTLVKQSFSAVDATGIKMHLIAYTSKCSAVMSVLPSATRDPLIQHILAQRTSAGRDPRACPTLSAIAAPPPSRPPDPPPRPATPAYSRPSHLHRSQSSLCEATPRPHTTSSSEDVRPHTSSFEPRSSSFYYAHPYRPATGLSVSFPSLAHHNVHAAPPPATGLSTGAAHSFPPLATSPKLWPFAYDAARHHSSVSSSSHSHLSSQYASPQPSLSPTFSTPSWPPSTANSSGTTASPFDPYPRHLPPLEALEQPAGLPGPTTDSPPGVFALHGIFGVDDEERMGAGEPDWRSPTRQAVRGAEDERQLRLLGRSF